MIGRKKRIITGSHPHAAVAGCGISLVGDTNTGILITDPFQIDVGFIVLCDNAQAFGRPVYESDYVYGFRLVQDSTYVGANTCAGFTYTGQVCPFDVTTRSSPSAGTLVDLFTTSPYTVSQIWSGALAKTGNTLFATAVDFFDTPGTHFSVVDISTPSAPTLTNDYTHGFTASYLGAYTVGGNAYAILIDDGTSTMYVYDTADAQQSSTAINYPIDLCNNGTTAYLFTGEVSYLIEAWDMSNPASPVSLGSYSTGLDFANDSAVGIDVVGTTVFYTAYDFSADTYYLYAVDFSNPASPAALGSITLHATGSDTFLDAVASNTRATTIVDSTYFSGKVAHAIDASNPSAMTDCSPNAIAYSNAAGVIWNANKYNRRSDGDTSYVYGWGGWTFDESPTQFSYDTHLAVYRVV